MIDRLNDALDGRYRVEELIGRGGMATVYRAVDLRHERIVAVKVMNPEFAETVGRDRFLREIRVTAGLTHPHVLPLYDSGDADGLLFYAMPFVDGISLRQRLVAGPRLPLDEVRKITREVASALSHAAARGIVHRDIKPENILLAGYSPGDTRSSWNTLVADFGIAVPTLTRGEHLTGTGIAVGSPQYMSPEQAVGERVDHRTDIWSLGCVVYEMLEGKPPIGVPSFRARSDVSPSLTRAVLRALAADPADRFDDARDFADAIDEQTRKSPIWWKRSAVWAGVVGVVAIAAATTLHRPVARGPRMTKDSLALAFYNRGRADLAMRTPGNVGEALSEFSRSVERDSSFALAWSGMARAAQFAVLRGFSVPGRSRDSLVALAIAASQRAVTLDSSAADVWLSRARVMETVEPTSRTTVLADLKRALAADSTNGDAWFLLGRAREELLDSAGARAAYERAVPLAPTQVELLAFLGLHYLWSGQPALGVKWADSAIAVDPTYVLGRDVAVQLAIEMRDWPHAEGHLLALERISKGPDLVNALGYSARFASLRGDVATARRNAAAAERIVDSLTLTKHEATGLGEALSAAGDTARAYRWLTIFTPRNDKHFQLHLHRDPALAWLHDPRYRGILSP